MGGVPVRDIVETLVNDSIQKPDIDQVYQTKKRNAMIAMEEIGTPGIACVIEIVKKYHGKIPMAVASSGVKTHVEKSLRDNGIYDLFDAVVTSEDVTNPKPAPDIFLEAARRINCNPKNCRGFEDSGLGLRALAKAGMEVVDVRKLENYPKRHASDVSVLDEKYKFPKF